MEFFNDWLKMIIEDHIMIITDFYHCKFFYDPYRGECFVGFILDVTPEEQFFVQVKGLIFFIVG